MKAVVAVETLIVLGIGRADADACDVVAISSWAIASAAVGKAEVASLASIATPSDHVLVAVALAPVHATQLYRLFFGALRVAVTRQRAVIVLDGERHD